MTRKRTAFIAAALVLLALLTTAAFAASGSTVITAELNLPDVIIEVTVPGKNQTYINPESFSVEIDGTVENGQIISVPAHIENLTVVPVSVSASVTAQPKGELVLRNTTTLDQGITSKRAFVYFQLRASDDPNRVNDWGEGYNADTDIIVTTANRKKKNYVTLAAGDQAERYGAFRLTGDCVEQPKIPWTNEDGFTATIVFTFRTMMRS